MMKALIVTIALVASSWFTAAAQTTEATNASLKELEDRMALKELVDVFSNLGDVKDVEAQVLLFTEDATVDSYSNGNMSSIKGRKNWPSGLERSSLALKQSTTSTGNRLSR